MSGLANNVVVNYDDMAYKPKPGDKNARLTFVRLVPNRPNKKCQRGLFKCDCGVEKELDVNVVYKGQTKSCGCLRVDVSSKLNLTHGHSRRGQKIPEYGAYHTMIGRCYNPNQIGYPDYGARGIRVCDRWLESFENFLEDMGRRPTPKSSIDRIDGNGPYCKENCRWSTPIDQANNRRSSRFITMDGRTQTVSQWCRELGLNRQFVQNRLKYMWDGERALKEPKYGKGTSKRFKEHLTGNHTATNQITN